MPNSISLNNLSAGELIVNGVSLRPGIRLSELKPFSCVLDISTYSFCNAARFRESSRIGDVPVQAELFFNKGGALLRVKLLILDTHQGEDDYLIGKEILLGAIKRPADLEESNNVLYHFAWGSVGCENNSGFRPATIIICYSAEGK